jgi:putative DNA primase/helicase
MARVMGSIALIAAARAGFVVVKDTKEPDTRYFLPIKNNIGNDREGFAYHIETVELSDEITTSKIVWHKGVVDAYTILHPEPEVKPTATNGAKEFLQEILSQGAVSAKEVFENAEAAGYSKSSIQRARARAGAKTRKKSKEEGWEWFIPECEYTLSLFKQSEGVEDNEDCIDLSAASSEVEVQPS